MGFGLQTVLVSYAVLLSVVAYCCFCATTDGDGPSARLTRCCCEVLARARRRLRAAPAARRRLAAAARRAAVRCPCTSATLLLQSFYVAVIFGATSAGSSYRRLPAPAVRVSMASAAHHKLVGAGVFALCVGSWVASVHGLARHRHGRDGRDVRPPRCRRRHHLRLARRRVPTMGVRKIASLQVLPVHARERRAVRPLLPVAKPGGRRAQLDCLRKSRVPARARLALLLRTGPSRPARSAAPSCATSRPRSGRSSRARACTCLRRIAGDGTRAGLALRKTPPPPPPASSPCAPRAALWSMLRPLHTREEVKATHLHRAAVRHLQRAQRRALLILCAVMGVVTAVPGFHLVRAAEHVQTGARAQRAGARRARATAARDARPAAAAPPSSSALSPRSYLVHQRRRTNEYYAGRSRGCGGDEAEARAPPQVLQVAGRARTTGA